MHVEFQYSSPVMLVIKALCCEWDWLEKVNPCLLGHTCLEFSLCNTEPEDDEKCLWRGSPVEISQSVSESWREREPCILDPIHLECSLNHIKLESKGRKQVVAQATDSSCLYWDLVDFLEQIFPFFLYTLRTIFINFKRSFFL